MLDNFCRRIALAVISMLVTSIPLYSQSVVYVDQDATGGNDGTSWGDAFVNLQDAIAVASEGDEVWIAEGVYFPDRGSGIDLLDREASFRIDKVVEIYGGFDGTETDRDSRDPETHAVILSGDLALNDGDKSTYDSGDPSREDNSFQVVQIETGDLSNPVVIDGVTIERGHAIGDGFDRSGGGIQVVESFVSINNSKLEFNHALISGGGIYVDSGVMHLRNSRLSNNSQENCCFLSGGAIGIIAITLPEVRLSIVNNVHFESNKASGSGGALNLIGGSASISNSTFVDNQSIDGGAIHASGPNPGDSFNWRTYVVNCTFFNNRADQSGGAISFDDSKGIVANSLFVGNGGRGGAISAYSEDAFIGIHNSTFAYNESVSRAGAFYLSVGAEGHLYNSIVWGNTAPEYPQIFSATDNSFRASHSIVDGGLPSAVQDDGGNLMDDPLFQDVDGPDGIIGTMDDDFTLMPSSPAIDSGDNDLLPRDSLDIDLDGIIDEPLPADLIMNQRTFGSTSTMATVDIGSYEYDSPPIVISIEKPAEHPIQPGLNVSEPYPNPATRQITIEVTTSLNIKMITVRLVDILGRVLYADNRRVSATHFRNQYVLDVSNLSAGQYFVSVYSDNGVQHSTSFTVIQ